MQKQAVLDRQPNEEEGLQRSKKEGTRIVKIAAQLNTFCLLEQRFLVQSPILKRN